jgi:hypothetical protein
MKKWDLTPSQLMKIRDLDQILENQYNIGQYIPMFLAIDNRKNPARKYCNLLIINVCSISPNKISIIPSA